MRYLGGKSRLGKKIAAEILARVPPEHRCEYLEPFLGGANAFEHIAPHFEKSYANEKRTRLERLYHLPPRFARLAKAA